MMKYGLKLWSNNSLDLFKEAVSLVHSKMFDFLELYAVPNTFNEAKLIILQQIPITIHATHEAHGFNLAKDNSKNELILKHVFQFADFLQAKHIILHLGMDGDFRTVHSNLSKLHDKRILIENMPAKVIPTFGNFICVGTTFEEIHQLVKLGFGLCLDFGHAIAASVPQHIPYKQYISQLLSLKPTYFHISDGDISLEYDEHKNLGEGTIDYAWIKSKIEELPNTSVVFETPKTDSNLDNDIKNAEYFRKL